MKNQMLPKTKQVPVINYEKWYNKLPLDKQLYIANMIRKKIDKIHEDTTEILDSCFMGAMIEELEMDLDKCIEVAKKANINMHETFKKLESEGNDYYMRVNDEKVRTAIIESAKDKLIKSPKKSTIDISRELQESYDLPLKDLHILVAESRKELKENGKEKFLNEIGAEMQDKLKSEVATDAELPYVIEEKELKEEMKEKSKLVIKSIEIEGQFGTYYKDEKGISTEKIFVKDLEDLGNYRETVSKEYNKGKNELLKKMQEVQEELNQLENRANKNFAIIDEIEQVFKI